MQSAVFDTNILIRFSERDSRAQEALDTAVYKYISIVTWAEFLAGIALGDQENARNFMRDTFRIIETDFELFDHTVHLRKSYGRKLKLPDALIYATAKMLKCPLITLNTRDFDEKLDDIVIPYKI